MNSECFFVILSKNQYDRVSVLRCNIGNTISDDGKFAVKDDPIEDCPAILCRNGSNSIGSGANQTGNHDGY
ncbi:unnamed protein product [Dracunculus medinensis]|uniref:ZP domain-containing protein n=1 Tax=Dracunculus medinensis TaxID=318479 RepID=A0A0N4U5V5_DRAME|nr:unnamed protein product [Dracunculus medinensis]